MKNGLLLLLPFLVLRGQQPERYGLVSLSGKDTLSVETVTRRTGQLTSEVLVPNRARLSVTATLDSDGCVTGVTEDVFPWGSAAGSTPLQHVRAWLAADSVYIEMEAGDVARAVTLPAPGAQFLLAEDAMGVAVQIVECGL